MNVEELEALKKEPFATRAEVVRAVTPDCPDNAIDSSIEDAIQRILANEQAQQPEQEPE